VRLYAFQCPACAVTAREDAIPGPADANTAAGCTMRGFIGASPSSVAPLPLSVTEICIPSQTREARNCASLAAGCLSAASPASPCLEALATRRCPDAMVMRTVWACGAAAEGRLLSHQLP